MGWIPISIDRDIKRYVNNNPSEKDESLRLLLNAALADYWNGIKCSCGNELGWLVFYRFGKLVLQV